MKDKRAKTDGLWLREATGVTQIKRGEEGGKSGVMFHFTEGTKEGGEDV